MLEIIFFLELIRPPRPILYAAAHYTWNATQSTTHHIGEVLFGWTWITWFFQHSTITLKVELGISYKQKEPQRKSFTTNLFGLIVTEDGPYRDKARAIYDDLRGNLIRYCFRFFCPQCLNMAEALINLLVNLNVIQTLLQKCGTQLSPDWVSVGTIWSEERQGKRRTCIYWLDGTCGINDGRSLWRKLGYLESVVP